MAGTSPAMTKYESGGGAGLPAARRGGDFDRTAGFRRRHRPEALEERLDLFPGALLEHVVMTCPRQDRHGLRLLRCMEHAACLIERNDFVPAAVDYTERHRHIGDTIYGAILIDHNDVEGKALPQQLADIDD